MKILWLLLIITGLLLGLWFAINYWSVMGHEEAHVQINKYFGAKSSYTINVDLMGIHGLTAIDKNANFYDDDYSKTAYLAHGINEAIGYQLVPFFNGIALRVMLAT